MRTWIIVGAIIISKTINPDYDFGWLSIIIGLIVGVGILMDVFEWIAKITK